MKLMVCDPCKKIDNQVTETEKYMRVKGLTQLRMDICPTHAAEVKKMSMIDYVRYAYKVNIGIELTQTDEQIKQQFLTV